MSALLLATMTEEINSSCICEDELGNYSEVCFDCYEDSVMGLTELLYEWEVRQEATTDYVRIDGKNLTWQNLEGYAETNVSGILDKLTINGDYRIKFILEGTELTAWRYSHDEPCGASFTFTFVEEEEL